MLTNNCSINNKLTEKCQQPLTVKEIVNGTAVYGAKPKKRSINGAKRRKNGAKCRNIFLLNKSLTARRAQQNFDETMK